MNICFHLELHMSFYYIFINLYWWFIYKLSMRGRITSIFCDVLFVWFVGVYFMLWWRLLAMLLHFTVLRWLFDFWDFFSLLVGICSWWWLRATFATSIIFISFNFFIVIFSQLMIILIIKIDSLFVGFGLIWC
jgi:hypothetical protein